MNKIKQTCGEIIYAKCTKYEGTLSEYSSLSEDDCLDIEQVAGDLYFIIDGIKEDVNLENLENTCITFTEPKTVSSIIEQMYNKICEMQNTLNEHSDLIETLQEQVENLQTQTCP
ncbi:MAG TPA: hypothetical protein VLA48_03320 [Nitrososphaeraceae archaeon]|nr:hypothetical protein [Nitrososphaeraceae archaeon]